MKKLLILLACLCGAVSAQQQTVNTGTGPQTGTGDPLRTAFTKLNANDAQLYGYNTHGREFSIYDYGAVCNGSTDDSTAIRSAEAAAASAGGGFVTGYGTCAIASPLIFSDPRIVVGTKHFGDGDHDAGSNDNGWTLKWTGTTGLTMLTFTAIAGASNQALVGDAVRGVTLDCNNSAGIGLLLKSVKGGDWNVYYLECTTTGIDMAPVGAAGSLGDASDVQYNRFWIRGRTILSTGIGIRARGVSGTANTSFDTFYDSQILYKNGTGIQLQDTDNLRFYGIQMVRAAGGSAIGVEISGDASNSSRSNFFYDLSPGAGGVTIRGTETNPVAVQNIQILGYDITNNPPAPVLGTGVTGITIYKENGHLSGSGMVNGYFGETDSSLSSAFTGCSTADSVCLYNGSQAGLRFLDGTGTWLLRQDGSHNLNVVRVAGSGGVTFNAPATISIATGTALTVTGVSGQLSIAPSQPVGLPSFTVTTLPTCNATIKGGMAYVTDATAPAYNTALTGGGAVIVSVFCNGTAWTSQ